MHTALKCAVCGRAHAIDRLQNVCEVCSRPLLAEYDLDKLAGTFTPDVVRSRPERSMWKFAEVLPIDRREEAVSMGEGMTPLLPVRGCGPLANFRRLFVKDESFNPTGSFKARGMSAAITRAKALGATTVVLPSAGNAGGAAASYAARAWPFVLRADARGHAELQRGRGDRRRRPGRIGQGTDQRLRQIGSPSVRAVRLVRPVNAERAVSSRGQENDGLRAGLRLRRRGDRPTGAPRRHLLSHRRRHGTDRHVEGV